MRLGDCVLHIALWGTMVAFLLMVVYFPVAVPRVEFATIEIGKLFLSWAWIESFRTLYLR